MTRLLPAARGRACRRVARWGVVRLAGRPGRHGSGPGRGPVRAAGLAWGGCRGAGRAGFRRTVTWYAAFSRSIRQVLDVGAMLPAPGLVSEAERQVLRRRRVVGAASDPAAGSKAGAGSAQVCADVRDPVALLAAAGETLNFTAPVVVLLLAVLDFVADADDPARIVGDLAAVPAPGSLIARTAPGPAAVAAAPPPPPPAPPAQPRGRDQPGARERGQLRRQRCRGCWQGPGPGRGRGRSRGRGRKLGAAASSGADGDHRDPGECGQNAGVLYP
jgi:hypothetical protein